ncbi:MAG: hypothetical protein HMLKMBBP_02202 [Planctomycetes bacterium]|nr:hypothetical protein [Planctomycetota bacterium]
MRVRHATRARAGLICAAALLTGSCGMGGVLAAAGGGGGGGGGDPDPPPPPFVEIGPPSSVPAFGDVTFTVNLRDPQVKPLPGAPGDAPDPRGPDDPRVRIAVEYDDPRLVGDQWSPVTEAEIGNSEGTRALSLGRHFFVWNSFADLGSYQGRVRVRVTAAYEDAAGIRGRRWRPRTETFVFDNQVCDTVFGGDAVIGNDVDTLPVDIRATPGGFVVANFGANVVESVNALGVAERLLGAGFPGDNVSTSATGRGLGVARLPTLIGVELDGAGNLYTNHSNAIFVSNRMSAAPLAFGFDTVQAGFVESEIRTGFGGDPSFQLASSRGMRFHPSGALIFLNGGTTVEAFNPTAAPLDVAGVTIPGGARATVAGGSPTEAGEDVPAQTAILSDAASLAIGPDGEIYFCERARGRVRVVNPGIAPVVIGGAPLAPGAVRTVAGTGTVGLGSPDGTDATSATLNVPGAVDVRGDRTLFIADTGNGVIRAVNLGPANSDFAGMTLVPGQMFRVVGGGDGGRGAVVREIQLRIPNAVCVDGDGHLLVADEREVVFANATLVTVNRYGVTAGPQRTALVYRAGVRGGAPLDTPLAVHSSQNTEVFFSDRATVRVLNLATQSRVFGGAAPGPGGIAVVGGGSVPGFTGDGGSSLLAAFSSPQAIAFDRPRRLFVADTGNDRVRFVNLGDPQLGAPENEVVNGVTIGPSVVNTIVGGAPGPLPSDGDGLAASACSLSSPSGVAFGNGNLLYVADTGHHRVRVVNLDIAPQTVAGVTVAPGTIRTLVGTGAAGTPVDGPGPWAIDTPTALALDARGLLYIALPGNFRICALNLTAAPLDVANVTVQPGELETLVGTGVLGNIGDGGNGDFARIGRVQGLYLQSFADGTPAALYFSDETSHVVRMLNLLPSDDLIVARNDQGFALLTAPAASVVSIAGGPNSPAQPNVPQFSGDGAISFDVRLAAPRGIAVVVRGGVPTHFFVADTANGRLRRFGAPILEQD